MNSTRLARSRRRRESTLLLLCSALLAVAWLTSPAEGSLPRAGLQDANPAVLAGAEAVDSGRFLTAGLETQFSLITVDDLEEALACNPGPEAGGLNLIEGLLLEPPDLVSRACEGSFSLHLEPVDFGQNPQPGPPVWIPEMHQGWFVAEPKTRIGGFGLNLEDLIGDECPLTLGLRRGYAVEGWGIAEEERPDPWGLESNRQLIGLDTADTDIEKGRWLKGYGKKVGYGVWNALTFGFVARHDAAFEKYEKTGDTGAYVKDTAKEVGRAAAIGTATIATGGVAGAGAKTLGVAIARGAAGGAASSVAGTAAGDVWDRAHGDAGASVGEYVSSAAGGALFGGAAGAFGHAIARARDAGGPSRTTNENWGSDTLDDALRMTDQPFAPRPPPQPTGKQYSVAFETRVDVGVWGRAREIHFNRANAALDAAIQSDQAFAASMESLIPGVSQSVARAGGRVTPADWVWHHAVDAGVMQLVPRIQHTPGSIFWKAMHPGGAGGYAVWAIPAGAPPN